MTYKYNVNSNTLTQIKSQLSVYNKFNKTDEKEKFNWSMPTVSKENLARWNSR